MSGSLTRRSLSDRLYFRGLAAAAVAGTAWTRQRGTSGNGITAPVTSAPVAEAITGYLVFRTDPKLTVSASFALERSWWFFAALGTDIQTGDVLQSVAVPGRRIQLLDVDTDGRAVIASVSLL